MVLSHLNCQLLWRKTKFANKKCAFNIKLKGLNTNCSIAKKVVCSFKRKCCKGYIELSSLSILRNIVKLSYDPVVLQIISFWNFSSESFQWWVNKISTDFFAEE